MVSYTFTLAPKANKTGERSIIISFIKDRKNTSLSIGKTCKEKDWSFDACRLKTSHPNHANLNKFIERRIKIIDEIIDDFDKNGIYFTLPDLINKLWRYAVLFKDIPPSAVTPSISPTCLLTRLCNALNAFRIPRASSALLTAFLNAGKKSELTSFC